MNFCSRTLAIAAGLACLSCPTALLAAEETSIEPVEKWSNVFSGGEVKFHYLVRTAQPFDGRLNWSLAFNERTIEHGQLPLTFVGAGTRYSGSAAEATVALKVPEVKEGVILESRLSIAAYAAGDPKPLATHVKTVWIFPREPFTDRSRWLQGLKITLFDPDGKTADVLEKARVPFTLTKNTAALGELREGLLVIGEGTAWRDYRSLGATIVKAAARGVPVLCLRRARARLRCQRLGLRLATALQSHIATGRHHSGLGQSPRRRGVAARRRDRRRPSVDQERPRPGRGRGR